MILGRVSVIIPNHNYGRYISDAVNSVLNQTYNNVECIVINNGSNDNSLEKALQHTVELTIHFKNTQFYSESHGEDLYQTIDSVIKKMWE